MLDNPPQTLRTKIKCYIAKRHVICTILITDGRGQHDKAEVLKENGKEFSQIKTQDAQSKPTRTIATKPPQKRTRSPYENSEKLAD